MSYIDSNLLEGESVVYRASLSPIIFRGTIFWIIVTIVLYIVLLKFNFDQIFIPYFPAISLLTAIDAIPNLFALLSGIGAFVRYLTSEFAVTDRRVIIKLGLIQRYTYENFLQKVESFQVLQSFWGRVMNFGTIVIHGTGGSSEVYSLLNDPLEFKKKADEQILKVLKESP